jgi:hypothetical protein
MAQQEITSQELYGIAKRINSELEALPLHTHSAVVEMLTIGKDHRNLVLKSAQMNLQNDQQERIIRLKEFEMEQARKNAPTLVSGGAPPN